MPKQYEIQELKLHTFRGPIPEVSTYETVDVALLEQGDDDPMYVTLAVMKVDEVSDNGLLYDEALVASVERQLEGSGGIRGHLSFMNEFDYPVEAVHWVGHLRDDDGVTWAKGYIPPGETREDVRRKKATNGRIGTSIYGYAAELIEDEDRDGVYRLEDFDLITLDLTPGKRASLKMGQWSGFRITAEMATETEMGVEEDNSMEPETKRETPQPVQRTAEPEEIVELKRQHKDAMRELRRKLAEAEDRNKDLTEIAALVEAADEGDVVVAVRAKIDRIKALEAETHDLLRETIESMVAAQVAVEHVRPMVVELVTNRQPSSRSDVAAALAEVMEQPYVKSLLKDSVREAMGPAHNRPVQQSPATDEPVIFIPGVN